MSKSAASSATPEQAAAPTVGVDILAAALAQAINATKPAPKITVANRTTHNPMNPTNARRKLAKTYYQNYDRIDAEDLTPAEYDLLPKLKAGMFIPDGREGFLIEVIDVKRGAQRGMHIRYNNGKIDTRMHLMSKAPTLEALLTTCIAEAEANLLRRKQRRAAGLEDDEE